MPPRLQPHPPPARTFLTFLTALIDSGLTLLVDDLDVSGGEEGSAVVAFLVVFLACSFLDSSPDFDLDLDSLTCPAEAVATSQSLKRASWSSPIVFRRHFQPS